jgi:hypothetical protein
MEFEMARPTLGPPRVWLKATLKRQVATTRMAPKKSHLGAGRKVGVVVVG